MRSNATIFAKLLALGALSCAVSWTASVVAQDEPDIRNLQPFVMVIVDSSGSMERLPNCACTTPSCVECLPQCSLPNDTSQQPPALKKNKWSLVLEALTGKFSNFACTPLPRTQANGMSYDVGYPIPYNQPWACPTAGSPCAVTSATVSPLQQINGVLDTYAGRLRFGLMTFDGIGTYFGARDLVPAASFNVSLSTSQSGMWSYGGLPHTFHYPKCTEDYAMDTGARSSIAAEGGLVSVSTNACATPPCDISQINATIQDTLLRTRPYGGTPIAASLDDLYYHLKNDATDTFGTCRDRYALLITDGYPDTDFREYGCDCKRDGNCPTGEDPNAMHCAYPRAEDAALNLINGVNGDKGQLLQLFVVGIAIDDPLVKTELNLIASQGASPPDSHGDSAIFVSDPTLLTGSLDTVFGGWSHAVSRSVPAFALPVQAQSHFVANPPVQYQISTGFHVAFGQPVNGIAPPWTGVIERQRFSCPNGATTPAPDALSSIDGDKYQDVLNGTVGNTRNLWTIVPASVAGAATAADAAAILSGGIDQGSATAVCGVSGCSSVAVDNSSVSTRVLGLAAGDTATQTAIQDWMYGRNGSVRTDKRLADIYHSSPAILTPPGYDSTDPDYDAFRSTYGTRPLTLFIGTNDGILHAFSIEDYTSGGTTLVAGQEIWGFVPSTMLPKLKAQLTSHQFGMDGVPELKDVRFTDNPAITDHSYHTVLVSGMRGGGNAYVALDVSDPIHPKFLWQFSDPDMGLTYGRPTIIQARFKWGSNTDPETRAVAILPGGVGTKSTATGTGCTTGLEQLTSRTSSGQVYTTKPNPNGLSGTELQHRQAVQCWAQTGRALYFVDVATGTLIKKIFDGDTILGNGTVFASPVVGSPTAYPDSVGTVATNGYVLDADGTLWRIDITATDPDPTHALSGWTVRPFHDLFWDRSSTEGETTYERPLVSIDDQRRLVVIVGTGDGDNFDKPAVLNRVTSLTEVVNSSPPTVNDYQAAMNWEIVSLKSGESHGNATSARSMVESELVTGSMGLFQGKLFFSTFISVADPTNACTRGKGRLWLVDYNQPDTTYNNGSGTHGPLLKTDTAAQNQLLASSVQDVNLFNIDVPQAETDLLVLGLGTTQHPACSIPSAPPQSYFLYNLPSVTGGVAPALWIVGQASGGNRKRVNAELGRVEVQLDRGPSFTRATGWASSID